MLGPKCVCLRDVQLFYCQVPLRGDYKKDVEDVKETAIKMLSREYSNAEKEFRLVNGYRRVDPRRGAEYILDIGIKPSAGNEQGIIRYFSLLDFVTAEKCGCCLSWIGNAQVFTAVKQSTRVQFAARKLP